MLGAWFPHHFLRFPRISPLPAELLSFSTIVDTAADSNENTSAAPEAAAKHRFVFKLKRYDDTKKWSVTESIVAIDDGEQREYKGDASRVGGFVAIVAALILMQLKRDHGDEATIDGHAPGSERNLAKRVYQALQDANKANGKNYLNKIFGTLDSGKKPSIVKVLRLIGRTKLRYQDSVDPGSVQVECSVNGRAVAIADDQIGRFLTETFGISRASFVKLSSGTTLESNVGGRAPNWIPPIAGLWNCWSTPLIPVKQLPDKILWTLDLKMNGANQISGACWYHSPLPGANRRKIVGRVEGKFNPGRGYLRLEWSVDDSRALGFGSFVLSVHSNGETMDGYGIGHSSEADGKFVVQSHCVKASSSRRHK
jgi:hypothetical protein